MTRRHLTAFVAALAFTLVAPSSALAVGSRGTIGADGASHVARGNAGTLVPVKRTTGSERMVGSSLTPPATGRGGGVVVDWSRIAFEAAVTDDGFVSFLGTRHQVMMHIAMHDALNAIDPRFDQYAYFGRSKRANPIAAAATAAHDVLVAVYPAQQATLDAELAKWLAMVPDGRG